VKGSTGHVVPKEYSSPSWFACPST
jgi:hypothetical protein